MLPQGGSSDDDDDDASDDANDDDDDANDDGDDDDGDDANTNLFLSLSQTTRTSEIQVHRGCATLCCLSPAHISLGAKLFLMLAS